MGATDSIWGREEGAEEGSQERWHSSWFLRHDSFKVFIEIYLIHNLVVSGDSDTYYISQIYVYSFSDSSPS